MERRFECLVCAYCWGTGLRSSVPPLSACHRDLGRQQRQHLSPHWPHYTFRKFQSKLHITQHSVDLDTQVPWSQSTSSLLSYLPQNNLSKQSLVTHWSGLWMPHSFYFASISPSVLEWKTQQPGRHPRWLPRAGSWPQKSFPISHTFPSTSLLSYQGHFSSFGSLCTCPGPPQWQQVTGSPTL